MLTPGCYECQYRQNVPGDAHSRCGHPKASSHENGLMEMVAMMKGRGPAVNVYAAVELGIKANLHGLKMGWFNWPYNFDPVWLEACNGFTPKE